MTIYCTRLVVYYFLHIKYTLPPKIHSPVWSKTTRICSCVGGTGADPLLLPKKEVVSYAIGSKCVISNIRQLVSDEMFVENQHTKSQKREVPPPLPLLHTEQRIRIVLTLTEERLFGGSIHMYIRI